MNHPKITILGCGPAGLLVALAADQKGIDARIISQGSPSPIGGAQYLHEHVPGLTAEEPDWLTYVKVGDEKGYAQKAYGEPEAQVSWDTFVTGDYPAWSLKKAYQKLWRRFGERVEQREVGAYDIAGLCREADLVFSTVPLPALCHEKHAHSFEGQDVIFTEEQYVRVPNLIVYNGRLTDSWYRAACLFGYCSTEYALGNGIDLPRLDDLKTYRGVKPVKTDCDCHMDFPNFIRVGRFGRWRRGVLTNHAYDAAKERIW